MTQKSRNMRLIGIVALILGYSILANHTLQSEAHAALGALVAIAPILLTCVLIALRSKHRTLMLGALIILSPLFWLTWSHFKQHYDWIYWLEHESLQLVLLFMFARTLLSNRQPLCTQFAEMIHGQLSPELTSYTRKVTIAWAIFFTCIIVVSCWLFFFYPIGIWSIFSNFIYLPLVAIMFIAEYMVRIWTLPKKDQANIMDAVHAFMDKPSK
jgi:uncharacterized membrane protein